MIDVVKKIYPSYYGDMIEILNKNNISYYNMFIARKSFVNEYCSWLFLLLQTIEPYIPIKKYDVSHQRVFGYYAEVLLNVYLMHKKYRIKEVYPVFFDEMQKNLLDIV